jgi:uncharacterized damage-inducible protein DinB
MLRNQLRQTGPGTVPPSAKLLHDMDLLDRLLGHDTWTTRERLTRCAALSDEQLDTEFDIGHGTVRRTLQHIVFNTDVGAGLMAGRITSQGDVRRLPSTLALLIERLDRASKTLADVARDVADRNAWDDTWIDVLDKPPATKTYGGAIAHVITHSMHHRAQLLYMMKALGLRNLPEGDVFSWESQTG